MKQLKFEILKVFRSRILKISKISFDIAQIFATTFVKGGHSKMNRTMRILKSMVYLVRGGMTPGSAKLCFLFTRYVCSIGKRQGLPGVVKHLKVLSVVLQQVLAGYKLKDLTTLGPRVSRSKTGYPRCIPAAQRELLRKGDHKAMKFWLTLFSVYRDIVIMGTVKLSTITQPSSATCSSFELNQFIPEFTRLF
jgi:hypothetical protein